MENQPISLAWRRISSLRLFGVLLLCVLSSVGNAQTLLIGTSYKSLLSTPEQDGMLDLIAKEAFRRIGVGIELPFQPAERSILSANHGFHDGELNRIAGMETLYPNLIRVPESSMRFDFVLFQRAQDPPLSVDGWDSLAEFYIGFVKGWKILERNTQGFPHLTLTNSAQQLFSVLDKGRVDGVLYGRLVGYAMVESLGLSGIVVVEPPLAQKDMFIYLHKRHAALVPQVAEALRDMKRDGAYQRIVEAAIRPYVAVQ